MGAQKNNTTFRVYTKFVIPECDEVNIPCKPDTCEASGEKDSGYDARHHSEQWPPLGEDNGSFRLPQKISIFSNKNLLHETMPMVVRQQNITLSCHLLASSTDGARKGSCRAKILRGGARRITFNQVHPKTHHVCLPQSAQST